MGDIGPTMHVPALLRDFDPVDPAVGNAVVALRRQPELASTTMDHIEHTAVREYEHLLAAVTLDDAHHRAQ